MDVKNYDSFNLKSYYIDTIRGINVGNFRINTGKKINAMVLIRSKLVNFQNE